MDRGNGLLYDLHHDDHFRIGFLYSDVLIIKERRKKDRAKLFANFEAFKAKFKKD